MNNEPEIYCYFLEPDDELAGMNPVYIKGFTGRWYIHETNLGRQKLYVECLIEKGIFKKKLKPIWLIDYRIEEEKIYPMQDCSN